MPGRMASCSAPQLTGHRAAVHCPRSGAKPSRKRWRTCPCRPAKTSTRGANWGAHDPAEQHWHLGPFAVRADAQARGIGSQLLEAFLELVDKYEGTAYLETDTARNVRFYERFGFETVGRDEVLGIECTFMSRRPTISRQ